MTETKITRVKVNERPQVKADGEGLYLRVFAHLAHIYSIPYKQYSELSFKEDGGETTVNVGDWYRLTFITFDGLTFLTKVDYLTLEGD